MVTINMDIITLLLPSSKDENCHFEHCILDLQKQSLFLTIFQLLKKWYY